MPRYYKEHGRGYDLDSELSFLESGGVRYQLGSAGSVIWVCPVCAEQHFRDPNILWHGGPGFREHCFKGHGEMELLTMDNRERLNRIYEAQGGKLTTIEERRAQRLADEAERPWDWVFSEKTEAHFPLGYAKEQ